MKYINIFILYFSIVLITAFGCDRHDDFIDNGLSEPRPTSDISIDSISLIESEIPYDVYRDLVFVNEKIGYAVSITGRIIKTIDSGKTWKQITSPTSLPLLSVQFLNEQTGFIIGGNNQSGVLLKTLNGGETWIIQDLNLTSAPSSICFLSPSTGFISGADLLIKTEDGGQNWINIKKHASFQSYGDIKFKNPYEGLILMPKGSYLKTTDGGSTWDSLKCYNSHNFSKIFYSKYKTFFWSNSRILTINSACQETIIEVPLMINLIFINEYQSIGVGQHYDDLGYFPSGDIFITNDTWKHYVRKTYSPSDAFEFTAISKMTAKKVMIIGTGFSATKVLILNL
jgi:hypothetical protein